MTFLFVWDQFTFCCTELNSMWGFCLVFQKISLLLNCRVQDFLYYQIWSLVARNVKWKKEGNKLILSKLNCWA